MKQEDELLALNVIRCETVLSKYPVHNLSKSGKVNIEVSQKNQDGQITVNWKVSPNPAFGEPRLLAYKVDTLIINRRIEELGRPLPRIIRLGSLREICRELGIDEGSTNDIKKALKQNASAFIVAKLKYKSTDGKIRTLEISDTRYGVMFTGEILPDKRKADAVYITPHDFYREVLNNAPSRPLDYNYLKALSPASQRFYEVLSYRIFATLKNKLPTADIAYSEYCMYSAQERYFTWEEVKKQMYKLHQPHLQSRYIVGFTHEATTDNNGNADWNLKYTPGEKAKYEYRAFI